MPDLCGAREHFGGECIEQIPSRRIRNADQFDNPSLPGKIVTTENLTSVSCGTEVGIVQEGIPDVIPPEACYLGWQESLALRIEAEIPGP